MQMYVNSYRNQIKKLVNRLDITAKNFSKGRISNRFFPVENCEIVVKASTSLPC